MPFVMLLQHWKAIALVAVVAAALIYREVLVHQRDSAQTQVTALTDAASALRAESASVSAAVTRQNEAIDALQSKMKLAEQDAAQREAQYASSGAQTMSREVSRANAVRVAPVPVGCQGAINWGNAQGPELGRW